MLLSERVGALSLCDFRYQATSLPFTFPSIGHVTRVWPESVECDQRDSQNAFFSSLSETSFTFTV